MYPRGGREKNDDELKHSRKQYPFGFANPISTKFGEYNEGSTQVTDGDRNTVVFDRTHLNASYPITAPSERESFVRGRMSDPVVRKNETAFEQRNRIGNLLEMQMEDDQRTNAIDNLKTQSLEDDPAQTMPGRLLKVFDYDLKLKILQSFPEKPE